MIIFVCSTTNGYLGTIESEEMAAHLAEEYPNAIYFFGELGNF